MMFERIQTTERKDFPCPSSFLQSQTISLLVMVVGALLALIGEPPHRAARPRPPTCLNLAGCVGAVQLTTAPAFCFGCAAGAMIHGRNEWLPEAELNRIIAEQARQCSTELALALNWLS